MLVSPSSKSQENRLNSELGIVQLFNECQQPLSSDYVVCEQDKARLAEIRRYNRLYDTLSDCLPNRYRKVVTPLNLACQREPG